MVNLKTVCKYKNKCVPTNKSYNFPTYKMSGEASFYLSIITGSRNSGKTNTVINILNIEKDVMLAKDNIVYWISGTKDTKVEHLIEKYPDNVKYIDTFDKKTMEGILDEIDERIQRWKEYHYIFELFEKYLHKEDSVGEQEYNILLESGILDEETDVSALIKQHNFQHPPISTIVVDDNLGSPLISGANSRDGKWMIKFIIKHRHEPHLCNVFILTQHYKMVSKPIRANTNNIIMFASKDASISDNIFAEFSPLFKGSIQNYHDALELVEGTPHGFLNLWYDKNRWVRLNFDKEITF